MKKLLVAFLISLSCVCVAAACKEENHSSSSLDSSTESAPPSSSEERGPENLSVTFVDGEGYSIVTDIQEGQLFAKGDTATFSVSVGAFYTGYPVVYVNGKATAPNDEGVYNIEMAENIEVTVEGLRKDVSNMAGTGAFDDAFVVSRPIDLLYIAEQVNKGNYDYVTGAYVLANDIDCGGEELKIIGDMSTENSFFSGCFTCVTDPDTGEMQRHTISNFTINSNDTNYVGLFGTVYADLSVTSSALFYGIQLDNFSVNASISASAGLESRSLSVGGLIGYGVGANIYLCDATNGVVNVYADDSFFSFAGGLIGYQQAFYMTEHDGYFPSEISYSSADVDVRIMRGMGLYAGGISGYLATNVPAGAAAFIHNSYATGNVSGAIRSGGIAGGLGQYTSVGNSYATGEVFAKASQSLDDILITTTEYCYSYAGGLVGFAENDTIVNDSFFAGSVSASAVSAGCSNANAFVGGGQAQGFISASAQKYAVDNCIDTVDLSDSDFFEDTLSWGSYDWVFARDTYPTVYYGEPEGTVTASMRLHYVAKNGETVEIDKSQTRTLEFFNTGMQSTNVYAPIGNYFVTESLNRYLKADNGYLSYGYYFDEACTKKVPYSYVPQKNIELYVGFADPAPVLGTYGLAYGKNGNELTLVLDSYAFATYTDGASEQQAYFSFDGETLIIEGARLARYYDGKIVIDEDSTDTSVVVDANFDMYRYFYYDFVGELTENGLKLYDGVYFTKTAPLQAEKNFLRGEFYTADGTVYKFFGTNVTKENASSFAELTIERTEGGTYHFSDGSSVNEADLIPFDAFKGTWTKSSTVNKTYVFDGMGNWSYEYKAYERNGGYAYEETAKERLSGTYTVENGVLTLTGKGITASFNSDGFLVIDDGTKEQIFYADVSYVGTWKANGFTLTLNGIGTNGYGYATASYGDSAIDLVYEKSETDGYVVLYYPHSVYVKDSVFGYFAYDVASNTLLATVADSSNLTSGYTQTSLFVVDDYSGEWICNAPEFIDVEFFFNGNGLYDFLYGYAGMEGKLTLLVDGEETECTYTLDSTLKGHFAYNGLRYEMSYDEDAKAIRLTAQGVEAELERKDVLANVSFVDLNGNTYRFDGRSNLSTGGILTVNGETEYVYKTFENGWKIFDGATEIGLVSPAGNRYEMTLNGNAQELYIANEFMGEWAIGGAFGLFKIGPTDLDGYIQATYKGYKVQLTVLEKGLLTFRYREQNMPITYYVFVIPDAALGYDVLVLSQYTNLASGNYSICTKANEFFGEWTRNDGAFTVRFDGVTSGSYSNGTAELSRGGAGKTAYYYSILDNGILMSSQTLLGGKTLYYKLEMLDILTATEAELNAADVYVKKDGEGNILGAFRRIEVDGLCLTNAKCSDGKTYFFDGGDVGKKDGNLYADGEIVYTYSIKSYNADNTATLELTDKNGVKYSATLNYSDRQNITLTIGEAIVEEESK